MKLIIFIAVLTVCQLTLAEKKVEELEAIEILQNEQHLTSYANCVLAKGECTQDATEVKGRIEDAFKDGCKRCNEEEIKELKTIFSYISKNKPELWKELTDKYDASGANKDAYASLLS